MILPVSLAVKKLSELKDGRKEKQEQWKRNREWRRKGRKGGKQKTVEGIIGEQHEH